MPTRTSFDRRRFLGSAAAALASAELGYAGAASAQGKSTSTRPASFGPVKQIDAGVLNVDIPAAELQERMKGWKAPAPRYPTGVFGKYCALVASASEGAVTNPALLGQPATAR